MTRRENQPVERLSTILARQAAEHEARVIALIREGCEPTDDYIPRVLETLETRQVVSSWQVRSLLVRAFRAGAVYARKADAERPR